MAKPVLDVGLEDLPDLGPGQLLPELHLLRRLDRADSLLDVGRQRRPVDRASLQCLDNGDDSFTLFVVGQAHDRALFNVGVAEDGLFDFR